MSKLTQSLKTRRFTGLAFSVAVLGILAGVVWTSRAQKQKTPSPTVTSRISAIQVVSTEPTSIGTSKVLVVKLQNTSEKEIKAYTITSGRATMTSNFFLTEETFFPGATIERLIPIASDANYQIPMDGKEVTVAAVYFADGTGDGLSVYVSSMADVYAGTRDQAKRILPCLQNLALTVESLEACQAEAGNLPVKENGKSSDYETGLELARDSVLRNLDAIKETTGNISEATNKQQKLTRIFKDVADDSKKAH
jgi:hypothetical protein